MNEKEGTVFNIALENIPVPGCTVSKEIHSGENTITYFSLAEKTNISAEIFTYHKLIIMADGSMTVYTADGNKKELTIGDCILTPIEIPVGMRTETSAVYTEISVKKYLSVPRTEMEDNMNGIIKAGEVFKLAELVPYQKGKIINMDVVSNEKMKFVVMSFDEGTGLSEHAAPGEALIFALDGEGVIGYEGAEHPIKAGENFHFAKEGMHFVKANGRFKMALLLTLE